jgi:dienelactone hydrolase
MAVPELTGFDQVTFRHEGRTHQVYRAGRGPAVIVIHEIPGIHPGMITFAQQLLQAGYTVYLPSLFGRPGQPASTGAVLRSILRVCVSREFAILGRPDQPGGELAAGTGGHGLPRVRRSRVGAIGMCLTGGFALAMAVDPAVLAPVVSQPGLPAPLTAAKRAAVGLDATDLAQVKERTHRGLCVLGLRFSADRGCPAERFQTLRRELGGAFEGIEVDSSPGNPHAIPTRAHAVLTVDLVDEPGHPTRAALDRVLGFLDQRLHP